MIRVMKAADKRGEVGTQRNTKKKQTREGGITRGRKKEGGWKERDG